MLSFFSALLAFEKFPKVEGEPKILSAARFLVSEEAMGIFNVPLKVSCDLFLENNNFIAFFCCSYQAGTFFVRFAVPFSSK
jgi:hypothetical protein